MPDAPDLSPYRAKPNDFVTPAAWNALCAAIAGAYDCVNAALAVPGYLVIGVRARETDAVLDPAAVGGVTALPAGSSGTPMGARRVGRFFVVDGLPGGDYDVTVTPPDGVDLAAQTRRATVRAGAVTEMTFSLQPAPAPIVVVPDLFRQTLAAALDALVEAGPRPGAVLDVHGGQVGLLQLGDRWQPDQNEQGHSMVVNLEPGAGAALAAGLPVDLLVTAAAEPPGP